VKSRIRISIASNKKSEPNPDPYQIKIRTRIRNTGGKLTTGGAPSVANISANFEKIETTLMLFLGAEISTKHQI
jgi:hypothetical protein